LNSEHSQLIEFLVDLAEGYFRPMFRLYDILRA